MSIKIRVCLFFFSCLFFLSMHAARIAYPIVIHLIFLDPSGSPQPLSTDALRPFSSPNVKDQNFCPCGTTGRIDCFVWISPCTKTKDPILASSRHSPCLIYSWFLVIWNARFLLLSQHISLPLFPWIYYLCLRTTIFLPCIFLMRKAHIFNFLRIHVLTNLITSDSQIRILFCTIFLKRR
jgi:hypothetical protein